MGKYDFVVWVVLLALVAVFTLVRKVIEKASSGERGKKIDLGKAVQAQLSKYMKAIEGTSSMFPSTPAKTTEESTAPVAPPVAPTATAPTRRAPPPLPAERARAKPKKILRRPLITTKRRPLSERTSAPDLHHPTVRRLSGKDVRRAIVLAEVLGPPVSERKEYRLF